MDKMEINVIISGAAGFIGQQLSKKYKSIGAKVIGIDKPNIKTESSTKHDIDLMVSSDEIGSVVKDIPNIDNGNTIFYNLAWEGVNGPNKADPEVQLSNIEASIHYLKYACEINCSKFISVGTIAEEGMKSVRRLDTVSAGMMYAAAKKANHLMLETYSKSIGQKFIWAQLSNIYGPTNKTGNLISYTFDQIKKGEYATFGPAEQSYDFVFIDDVIEALYRLGMIDTNESFYFLGSGRPKQLKDYLIEIGRICGNENMIKIGARTDDGIKYDEKMFDISGTTKDIGNYVTRSFSDRIKQMAAMYGMG